MPGFSAPNFFSFPNAFNQPTYYKWNFELEQALGGKMALTVNYSGMHGMHIPVADEGLNGYCPASVCPNGFAGLPTAPANAALGFVATWGLYDRLPAAVGIRQATELCLSGRRIDAREAVALGLANRAVPLPELLQASLDCARRIAALEPSVRTEILRRVRQAGGNR